MALRCWVLSLAVEPDEPPNQATLLAEATLLEESRALDQARALDEPTALMDGADESEDFEPELPAGGVSASASALVTGALDLVDSVLGHLRALGVTADADELRAYGRQGLLEAAARFDPERGDDFRKFAYLRVRGAMLDGMRKMGSWSRRGYERIQLMRAAHATTEAAFTDASPTARLTPEVAAERLRQHMAQMATAMTLGVFVEAAFDGTEVVSRDPGQSAEEALAEEQVRALVRLAVTELPELEAEVVQRYYLQGQCLDDVARDWGCTKSWVSRVHTRAIKRLGVRLRGLK